MKEMLYFYQSPLDFSMHNIGAEKEKAPVTVFTVGTAKSSLEDERWFCCERYCYRRDDKSAGQSPWILFM